LTAANDMSAEAAGRFFHTYSEAFAADDIERVLAHHDHPLTVVRASGAQVFPDRAEARAFLQQQMDGYRSLGMAWPVPAAALTFAYGGDLARAEVMWILRDRDGRQIARWTTIYCLRRTDQGWRLCIIVSHEEPAAMASALAAITLQS
jgi:ketosteroid isomerase-like protein